MAFQAGGPRKAPRAAQALTVRIDAPLGLIRSTTATATAARQEGVPHDGDLSAGPPRVCSEMRNHTLVALPSGGPSWTREERSRDRGHAGSAPNRRLRLK